MKIYDLSIPIQNSMLTWPGDPGVKIETKTTVAKQGVMLSYFSLGSHIGTHIDGPNHFLPPKATGGIDAIELEKLIGECIVVDLTKIETMEITKSALQGLTLQEGSRILFRTGNFKLLKQKKFTDKYVSLSLGAAKYLARKKIYLVGIDYLGIEKKSSPGHPVHKTLLSAGIVIVEGLDLEKVPAGRYQLICLPLRVAGADGSPARAVLIESKIS